MSCVNWPYPGSDAEDCWIHHHSVPKRVARLFQIWCAHFDDYIFNDVIVTSKRAGVCSVFQPVLSINGTTWYGNKKSYQKNNSVITPGQMLFFSSCSLIWLCLLVCLWKSFELQRLLSESMASFCSGSSGRDVGCRLWCGPSSASELAVGFLCHSCHIS